MTEKIVEISRRKFLQTTTGLSFGFALTQFSTANDDNETQNATALNVDGKILPASPYAWVNIAPSGRITVQTPVDELGQGSMTALPLILAEELDADWDDVIIEFSEADDEVYGNPNLAGLVLTVASWAVNSYYDKLRIHGAQMRRILLESVAAKWRVPIVELHTESSRVIHKQSQRYIRYGDIVAFTDLPQEPPAINVEELKPREQFKLIGSDLPRRDIAEKTNGSAQYSIDIQLTDMLYATVIRPSIRGAKIRQINTENVKKEKGVQEIVNLKDRIAIVADTYTTALKMRDSITVEWDSTSRFDSDIARNERTQQVQNLAVSGFPWEQQGNITEAFNKATKTITGQYQTDYVYHAQIEPLNGVAWYKENGELEVWAGTQAPSHCLRSVAETINIDTTKVILHRMYCGGAFGRRGAYDHDYVIDAAILSKQFAKPVKVIWSREDDVRLGRLKPMSAQYLRAGLNEAGQLTAWQHRVASEETLTQGDPYRYDKWGNVPITGIIGAEQPVYDIPNRKAEHILQETNVRVSPLRGVGATPNKFAAESFLDEIALTQGDDPLEVRLRLVENNPRAKAVLTKIAEIAHWHRPRENTALGLAFTAYANSMLACIAEVSVNKSDGNIIIHNLWSVVDPGLVIQPINTESQIEGGLLFGLSNALKESVKIKNGEIQQSNYHDYPILRANEVPNIHVRIIQGSDRPFAVGELGVLLPAPAIGNAFARLTGKRLRHMPFTAERVRKMLA